MNSKVELTRLGKDNNSIVFYHNNTYTSMRNLPDETTDTIVKMIKDYIAEYSSKRNVKHIDDNIGPPLTIIE